MHDQSLLSILRGRYCYYPHVIILTWQARVWRRREMKPFVQGSGSTKLQILDLNPGIPALDILLVGLSDILSSFLTSLPLVEASVS